jgi:hypothetical protein
MVTPKAWIENEKPKPKLVAGGEVLRNQVNEKWPKRDKRTDGWISDASHMSRDSDHNPDARGVVHALDFDHNMGAGDKRQGPNAQRLADELIAYARRGTPGSERLKYVVYNNQIASGTYSNRYWVWRKGNYGHTEHIHVSFTTNGERDRRKFTLPIFGNTPELLTVSDLQVTRPGYPGKDRLAYGQKNQSVVRLQKQLIARGYSIPAGATAYYGDQTKKAVKSLYHKMRKTSSGNSVGPAAWEFLFKD